MTDPLADMLVHIRNAQAVGHQTVTVSFSELKLAVAEVLKREGYVESVEKHGRKTRKELELRLAYKNGLAAITGLRRISKPGKRIYRGWRDAHPVRQGFGVAIISTPQGLLTDGEARKMKVGGEVLLEVW